jgi:Ran GTPase-activating protein (RanGAP) involved in mRNA processing and transport
VAGAKALAEALAANTVLTSLTLSDNYIGVEGAKALAEALVQNKSLAELSIKGNELGDEGVEALATALLVSERLFNCCVALPQQHLSCWCFSLLGFAWDGECGVAV